MRKTLKYKLYRSKRNKRLVRQIEIASFVWNHCIALHRRYYSLYGKHLHIYRLQKHITKLKKQPKFAFWKELGSEAVQEVTERIDRSYKAFFDGIKAGRKVRPPSFCKRKKYRSFTLKQWGYKLLDDNRIRIGDTVYKYSKSRPVEGTIKTVTIKRDAVGDLWICFSVVQEASPAAILTTGKSAGFDFGLKTFLTASDGTRIIAPEPLKGSLKELRKRQQSLSRKKKGSNNRTKARLSVARLHRRITNVREDWHRKTALDLLRRYDVLYFETLNLKGMQALWGRKVSDLGFASFMQTLEYMAAKYGREVVKIDKWEPTSKACSTCGSINTRLLLSDREWVCADCGSVHDRDLNAALNIYRVGASTRGVGDVRREFPAVAA